MDLTLYNNNEELNADVLNRPLLQLLSEVNSLAQQVALATSGNNLYTTGVPYDLTSGVIPGMLVYIGDDGLARPALAVWDSTTRSNGVILAHPSAYVVGLVMSVDSGAGTANVVTRGCIPAAQMAGLTQVLFNGQTGQGTWYLSQEIKGVVVRDSDGLYLKLPVIKVDVSGNVYLTGAQPFTGYHIHKTFTVPPTATWTQSGSSWVYSGNALDDLTFFNWTDATMSIDGVYDYSGKLSLSLNGDSVILSASEDMSGKTVGVFIAIPDAHAQPVVRGIRGKGSSRLTITGSNGLYEIGVDSWDGNEPAPTYRDRAVSALTDNGGYSMTKVVSRIVPDGSIIATEGDNGVWAIGAANGPWIRPTTVSLENATITTSDDILYYIFPYSRASAIIGKLDIPAPPDGWHWIAKPFVQAALSTVNVTASIKFANTIDPDDDGGDPEALTPASVGISADGTNGRGVGLGSSGWEISEGGDAWLKLSASGAASQDMSMISFGLYMELEEDE